MQHFLQTTPQYLRWGVKSEITGTGCILGLRLVGRNMEKDQVYLYRWYSSPEEVSRHLESQGMLFVSI